MIRVVVVVAGEEMQEGIRRLLESDGDIQVIAGLSSLHQIDGDTIVDDDVVVVGPRVAPTADEWTRVLSGGDHRRRVVVLTAVPGRMRYPPGVVEVPLELTGRSLRLAVRRAITRWC